MGWIGALGYGARRVRIETIDHGMSVIPYEQGGDSRNDQTLYIRKVTSGSFSIGVAHPTYAAYVDFNEWLRGYCEKVNQASGDLGVMRVIEAGRDFDKMGIPDEGIEFGDETGKLVYRQVVKFVGASDPVLPKAASVARRPRSNGYAWDWFYPVSPRLAGKDVTNDDFFRVPDPPDDDVAPDNPFW